MLTCRSKGGPCHSRAISSALRSCITFHGDGAQLIASVHFMSPSPGGTAKALALEGGTFIVMLTKNQFALQLNSEVYGTTWFLRRVLSPLCQFFQRQRTDETFF